MKRFELTLDHHRWASAPQRKRRYRRPTSFWLALIESQRGLCALSDAPLLFHAAAGTPLKGGHSQHPIYAVVDHLSPANDQGGFQIVSNDLNDLKGHLPRDLFGALQRTRTWKALMRRWREQALRDPYDREAFRALRQGAV